MAPKPRKSGRLTLKKKYKIQRKVREHHRKVRKETKAKKHRNRNPKSIPAEDAIPATHPHKQKIIAEIAAERDRLEAKRKELREIRRAEQKARQLREKEEEKAEKERNEEQGGAFDLRDEREVDQNSEKHVLDAAIRDKDNSFRTYMSHVKSLVEKCDVILNVLDARHPMAGRSTFLEDYIRSKGKKIFFVLNKIDMLPSQAPLDAWVEYLSREAPCVAFRSTLAHRSGSIMEVSKDRKSWVPKMCSGVSELRRKLGKMIPCSEGIVTAGVVGYPNVGKSAVVNSLKRSAVVQTGSKPGVTKHLQEVVIDKRLRLFDCPGVVFDLKDQSTESRAADNLFRNTIKVEKVEDPLSASQVIYDTVGIDCLRTLYGIQTPVESYDGFLHALAQARGKLKQGGAADLEHMARQLLNDWNRGRIPFYTTPPELEAPLEDGQGASGGGVDVQVLTGGMDAPFNPETMMSGMSGKRSSLVGLNRHTDKRTARRVEDLGTTLVVPNGEETVRMDTSGAGSPARLSESSTSKRLRNEKRVARMEAILNPQTNLALRRQMKARAKSARRSARRGVGPMEVLEPEMA